jgi:flagellar basal-body rod protein FlgF
MADGIYAAVSGASAQSRALDIVSNNLANAPTTGFKSQHLTFEEVLHKVDGVPNQVQRQVRIDESYTNFRQGSLEETGNPLDVALSDTGFFVVETENGPRYTRDGHMAVSDEGVLVTAGGYPVQGEGGEIRLQPQHRTRITQEGVVMGDGQHLGTLRRVDFADKQKLIREGHNLWKAPEEAGIEESQVRLQARSLEGSNVNIVESMTEMVWIARAYEVFTRTVDTFKKVDERTATQITA